MVDPAGLDWTAIILALIAAASATFAAWLGWVNAKMLRTNSGKTIGQHIEALQGELAQIADAKLLADARLASAALVAVSKLARETQEDMALTVEARRTAADVLAKANRAAEVLDEARDGPQTRQALLDAGEALKVEEDDDGK